MKTVSEWLQELPEPYRTQALENMGMSQSQIKVICMREALFLAFDSRDTPQGKEYWDKVYTKLENNEPLTPITETMSGHPHAKLAQEYWKEAETNAEAWKSWEYRQTSSFDPWQNCWETPRFYFDQEFRRKPRTITINGHEVPEPLRVKPNFGELYYFPELSMPSDACENCDWEDDEIDNERLIAGICHSTQEAAIAHAKALLSFTQKGGEA